MAGAISRNAHDAARIEPLRLRARSGDLPPAERDVAGVGRAWPDRPGARGRDDGRLSQRRFYELGPRRPLRAGRRSDRRIQAALCRAALCQAGRPRDARQSAARLGEIQAFTKWVPPPGPMTRPVVEDAIGASLKRMGVDRLDLLQFHWWDYGDRRYLDALKHLADLREGGKIRHLGLTNFDTERLAVIAENGIRIVSNQVQYSVVDRRPGSRMAEWGTAHAVSQQAHSPS